MYALPAWKVGSVTQIVYKKEITPKIGAKDYSYLSNRIERKTSQDRVSSRVWEENVFRIIPNQYRRY